MTPNLKCRMYEAKFPEVDMVVMIQVNEIADMGVNVSLLEYNNIKGFIYFSELSKGSPFFMARNQYLIKLGKIDPAVVRMVDKNGVFFDLSKKRVSINDSRTCVERYDKSRIVHSIMRRVAETLGIDLEELYINLGWPLYRKYGHAFEAFKLILADPDSVLDSLTREVKEIGTDGQEVTKVVPALSEEAKEALVKQIMNKMTPKPLKFRAYIEMKCFEFDGVLHIKEAIRKAEAAGNAECPVKIKLAVPPLYVLTANTPYKAQGIAILWKAITACKEEIEQHKGQLNVKQLEQ